MRFLCDAMFGRLAAWLRIFGYDAELASGSEPDDSLVERARLDGRVFLTGDKATSGSGVIHVPQAPAKAQLLFLRQRLGIEILDAPKPNRCSKCNARLLESKGIWKCEECGQEFWKGSHWPRIREFAKGLNNEAHSKQ